MGVVMKVLILPLRLSVNRKTSLPRYAFAALAIAVKRSITTQSYITKAERFMKTRLNSVGIHISSHVQSRK